MVYPAMLNLSIISLVDYVARHNLQTTANCPILGALGSSRHLLRREVGSLACLRMALSEHRASI